MSDALDKIAVDVAAVDDRLRLANDEPDCFLCGRKVRPEVCYSIESDFFHALKAHGECMSKVIADAPDKYAGVARLFALARKAMWALYRGKAEAPAPGQDIVRGAFR